MAQPSIVPEWNTTPATNNVDPGATAKGTGWLTNQIPPSSWLNWWQRAVWEWIVYLKFITAEALTWTAAQVFQVGITVTNTITSGYGVQSTGGTPNGTGVRGNGQGSGYGVEGVAAGTGAGVRGFGGTGGSTGPGVQGIGGATDGNGGLFTPNGSGVGVLANAGSTGVAAQLNGMADLDSAAAIAGNVPLKNKLTKNNVCKAWVTFSWASGVYTIIASQNVAGIASPFPALGAMQVTLAENVPVATRSAIAADESELNKAVTKDATAGTDSMVQVFIYNAAGSAARDLSATSGRATLHVMGIQ